MRLSLNPNDYCYTEKAVHYEVYLDGEKVEKCITADEEKGYVEKYKVDGAGEVVTDFHENGEPFIEIEELYGEVEIKKST